MCRLWLKRIVHNLWFLQLGNVIWSLSSRRVKERELSILCKRSMRHRVFPASCNEVPGVSGTCCMTKLPLKIPAQSRAKKIQPRRHKKGRCRPVCVSKKKSSPALHTKNPILLWGTPHNGALPNNFDQLEFENAHLNQRARLCFGFRRLLNEAAGPGNPTCVLKLSSATPWPLFCDCQFCVILSPLFVRDCVVEIMHRRVRGIYAGMQYIGQHLEVSTDDSLWMFSVNFPANAKIVS